MTLPHWHHLVLAAVLTLFLAVLHIFFFVVRRLEAMNRVRVSSFTSGLIVAYVFLHMLPALVEAKESIHKLVAGNAYFSNADDLIIFLMALIGFEIFYCVEHFTIHKNKRNTMTLSRSCKINMVNYFCYNFFIGYSILISLQASIYYTVVFVIAIGLHFIAEDDLFTDEFKELFTYKSRLILIAGLFIGFIVSILLYPVRLYVALLIALLCGAILYNAFKEEFTDRGQSSVAWFILGSVLMTILLGLDLST
jgi:hypothetical protein